MKCTKGPVYNNSVYCPNCFNDTLNFNSRGVIRISFNGKSKNTSLFTYNLNQERNEELYLKLREKIEEYFKWYSQFNHKSPIKVFECYTTDVQCTNKCRLSSDINKVSVIESIFDQENINEILEELGKKHKIPLELP